MSAVVSKVKDEALINERQQEIIEAARRIIRAKGFHAATVRDIATEARMTQGTLYNYITSKDDILFLVCSHLVASYQDAILAAIQADHDPGRRLASAVKIVIEVMHKHQEDLLLIYQESHLLNGNSLKVILDRVASFVDFFVELVRKAEASGSIRCRNVGITAEILTFLPLMVALRRWDLKKRGKPEEVMNELIAFVIRGLNLPDDILTSAPAHPE